MKYSKAAFRTMNILAISLCMAITVSAQGKHTIVPSPSDLLFSELPATWDEGIPLGNGMVGALVWKKENNLRISLDRADLWDLRPMGNVYKKGFSYQWVQEQWKKEQYLKVQEAFDHPYDQSAGPSKIPAAALEIPLGDFGPVESVRLLVHHGICMVYWKNGISMELFIDPIEPVGWFKITGTYHTPEIKVVPPPYTVEPDPSARNMVTGGQDLRRLEYPAGKLMNGPNTLEYSQEGWEGFNYRVFCQIDRTKQSTVGSWSISSHYPDQKAVNKASETIENARKVGYEKSRSHLLEWWNQYWAKSSVSIPDSVLQKQWALEMYKFGAAARKGAPPISLQAVWTADNGKLPPWKGDFHHDLNTQLSYWPAYGGNHLDLEEGFLDWLWMVREEGKKYTRWFYEAEGLNFPGVTTLTGQPMGGWIQYSFGPTVSAWLGHHFYLHWRYSMDETFLKERAYPWMKDVVVFLDQITVRDETGMRKLPLSSSPEIYNNSREAWFEETTNYDLSLIRFAYSAAAELAEELDLQDEADHWREVLSEWPGLTVDQESGLMFAPGFPYDESHRHFSHLMGYHPLGLIDVSNGVSDHQTILNTLRNLENIGSDWWTGYSFSWLGNLYARAFEGENAADILKIFATCFTLPNSFHVNGDQSGTGLSKFTYRPFTLEGNFAFASAIHEMLLQSHTGVIRIFPAIPGSWKEVSFSKLRTEGAFLISAEMRGGLTTRVVIEADKKGIVKLANPFEERPYTLLGIPKEEAVSDQGIIKLNLRKGEVVILES